MEKLVLALVTTAQKLRPYFQAHTIEVPTEYPMKKATQTRGLRKVNEVGHRVKRVRYHI